MREPLRHDGSHEPARGPYVPASGDKVRVQQLRGRREPRAAGTPHVVEQHPEKGAENYRGPERNIEQRYPHFFSPGPAGWVPASHLPATSSRERCLSPPATPSPFADALAHLRGRYIRGALSSMMVGTFAMPRIKQRSPAHHGGALGPLRRRRVATRALRGVGGR